MTSLTAINAKEQFENEVFNLFTAFRSGVPGVTRLYGICQKNSTLCIVMHLYPTTLAKVLSESANGLPISTTLEYMKMLLITSRASE